MKWLWRYNIKKQALKRQVISYMGEQLEHWSTKPVRTSLQNRQLESVRHLWEKIVTNTGFEMRNGRTSFWNDFQLGHEALKALFPNLFFLSSSPNATIEEHWSSKGWNLSFRRLLNDWEVNRITDSRRLYLQCCQREQPLKIHSQSSIQLSIIYRAVQHHSKFSFSWLVIRKPLLVDISGNFLQSQLKLLG